MKKYLKSIAKSFKRELKVYQLVLKDKRTPKSAKVFLGAAVAYALMPFDLIPDFIPVLGHLDDVVIIPLLVWIGVKLVPKEVIEDCRREIAEKESSNL